jgi:hypothetical protein
LEFRREGNDARTDAHAYQEGCGCLIDTLERIKRGRPLRVMTGATEETFSLAMLIGLGDTPQNSKWARAAAKGVEDYITSLEVAA